MRMICAITFVATMLAGVSTLPAVNPTSSSKGSAAMQQAAAAEKYLFVFFWKDQNPQTDAAWQGFQAATANAGQWANVVSVGINDPAEKPLVDRYGLTRAPMPLVMSFAPNGAVTKAFPGKVDEQQLQTALVSPGYAQCLKSLQERKLVLLCVQHVQPQARTVLPRGVVDFKSDPNYATSTEIVPLNADDAAEASFLKELKVDSRTPGPVTLLMAPPGTVVGKFDGAVTKKEIVAKLATAQSSCCPGGQCGPGGCGPKK